MVKRGGNQALNTFVTELGFDREFETRVPQSGETLSEAIDWITNSRPKRQNYWPALSLAFISQAEKLLATESRVSVDFVFKEFEIETSTAANTVNTLNFIVGQGEPIRLRNLYNAAAKVVKDQMLRDHPGAAPHATQSWQAYRPYISLIYRMTPGERRALANHIWTQAILPLPEHEVARVRDRVVRPFEHVLANMPTAQPRVRGGALLQALAFGYLHADSPNLILESHSVNTGSSRVKMLGDVDGFRGAEPELAAEVKDLALDEHNAESSLGDFLEDIATAPNATAVVVCRTITDEGRVLIEKRNVTVLTVAELIRTVGVWDLPKQQEALRGVDYYLGRIQKSQAALEFFRGWLIAENLDAGIWSTGQTVPIALASDTDES